MVSAGATGRVALRDSSRTGGTPRPGGAAAAGGTQTPVTDVPPFPGGCATHPARSHLLSQGSQAWAGGCESAQAHGHSEGSDTGHMSLEQTAPGQRVLWAVCAAQRGRAAAPAVPARRQRCQAGPGRELRTSPAPAGHGSLAVKCGGGQDPGAPRCPHTLFDGGKQGHVHSRASKGLIGAALPDLGCVN